MFLSCPGQGVIVIKYCADQGVITLCCDMDCSTYVQLHRDVSIELSRLVEHMYVDLCCDMSVLTFDVLAFEVNMYVLTIL